jgi:subtilisin family serine protease
MTENKTTCSSHTHRASKMTACLVAQLMLAVMLFPVQFMAQSEPVYDPEFKGGVTSRAQRPASSRPAFVPGEVLVKYKTAKTSAAKAVEQNFQLMARSYNTEIGVYRYQLPLGREVFDQVAELSQNPAVEFAEPNYYRYHNVNPNDPFYANFRTQAGGTYPNSLQRWVYNGIGSNKNVNGEAAWDLTTGRPDVVIAIIDSGVKLDHPDLAPNIWRNPGETPGNGRDDDGNGFIDDINGWDFRGNSYDRSEPDNDPNPDLGDGKDNDESGAADDSVTHGTFVAGVAGARGNDSLGVAGTCWNCKLMALKVFTDDGGAADSDIADAITYAANNGAAVINLSLGGEEPAQVTRDAVNFAHSRGVVIVAAAGNANVPTPSYPAAYDHVISVGATNYAGDFPTDYAEEPDIDGRASFSQFGPAAVDVVAPGILASTSVLTVADQQNGAGPAGTPILDLLPGTSFSSPLVAGLAGLIVSHAKAMNIAIANDQVENIIQSTAVDLPDDPDDMPDGGPNWDGRGRVNLLAALQAVRGGGPPPGGDTVMLTSGVPVMGSIPAPQPGSGLLGQTQYTIQVPTGAQQLKIDLSGNQDVDLYVRFGQRIVIENGRLVANYGSESPTGTESIMITPSSSPPLRQGMYFIAVGNFGPSAATFTVTATVR